MSAADSERLFRMPTLGADMTEGRVAEWLVTPGTEVQRGDLVAVIETEKSDIEIEVFEPCVFEEFLVELGELVPVGTPIARIRPSSAGPDHVTTIPPTRAAPDHVATIPPPTPAAPDHVATIPPPTPAAPDHVATIPPPTPAAPDHVATIRRSTRRATPRARRLARERGVDLDSLQIDGTITGDDVLRLAADTTGRPEPVTDAPTEAGVDVGRKTDSVRLAIAVLMERSWQSIPHYHVAGPLDVTAVEARLAQANLERPPTERLLLGALLNAAVARAAADVAECNGWWRSGAFVPADSVDLGMVVSLRTGGILVPTIPAADRLSAAELMDRMRELVERARRGRLRGGDLGEASITVTSLGDVGAQSVAGVIHAPQVTLVGLGSVRDEAVVDGGAIGVGRIVHATVAGDHRAHDGRSGARLLERVRHHLEDLP